MDIPLEWSKAVQSTQSTGKYYEMLNAQQKAQVDAFVAYLSKETKMTKDSISSYKSYVCKAIHSIANETELTNNQKSAFRKFLAFLTNHS